MDTKINLLWLFSFKYIKITSNIVLLRKCRKNVQNRTWHKQNACLEDFFHQKQSQEERLRNVRFIVTIWCIITSNSRVSTSIRGNRRNGGNNWYWVGCCGMRVSSVQLCEPSVAGHSTAYPPINIATVKSRCATWAQIRYHLEIFFRTRQVSRLRADCPTLWGWTFV